jgi:hypothetical protein
MPFALTASPVESLVEAQLNFEQIAALLSVFSVGTGAPVVLSRPGYFYFRLDGGAMTTIYQMQAGAWVGIV